MTARHEATITFPTDLEVLLTRDFDAPIQLVFDVFTKPEHVVHHIAPFGEEVTVCDIDLRVGGESHYIFVTEDGTEMSFRGTYLELDPPRLIAGTWHYDGWPGVDAMETVTLSETDGVTTLRWSLVFNDQAGRDHMKKYDGIESGFDNVEAYLATLT